MTLNDNNLLNILHNILKEKSIKNIAVELNIAQGTIKRWIELKNVPKLYTFELMRIANIDIDYTKFSYKEKDQFFTPKETVLNISALLSFTPCIMAFGEILSIHEPGI